MVVLGILTDQQKAELDGIAGGVIQNVSEVGSDAVEVLLGHAGELEQRVRHMDKQRQALGQIIDTLKDERNEARKEADHWRELAEKEGVQER